jgi:hypothetical protein
MSRLRAGDIMFGPIHGAAGAFVGVAQLTLAAAEPGLIWRQGWRKWFRVRHVGVMVDKSMMVEAMPSGARMGPLGQGRYTSEYVYIRPDYADRTECAECTGNEVADAAVSFVGTPYNFATYAAIPAHRAHIPVPHLDRYIQSRRHMMCSQLADQALADAGWHVFDDGRLPQDVTPSELFRAMLMQPTDLIIRGDAVTR